MRMNHLGRSISIVCDNSETFEEEKTPSMIHTSPHPDKLPLPRDLLPHVIAVEITAIACTVHLLNAS